MVGGRACGWIAVPTCLVVVVAVEVRYYSWWWKLKARPVVKVVRASAKYLGAF